MIFDDFYDVTDFMRVRLALDLIRGTEPNFNVLTFLGIKVFFMLQCFSL